MAIPRKTNSCKKCTNKSSCFKKLSLPELELIDKNRLEVVYKKNETILKQGAFASSILFLKKGLLKLYIEGKNNKDLIISIVPEGNLIGLPSLFGDPIFHYSAVAYEESTVCLIGIEMFQKFAMENAQFSAEVINIINQSTIQSFDRFFSISQKNVPGRFADLILYLSNNIYKKNAFKLPLTRRDLADLASISIESLSRVIKEFNDDKIIRLDGKELKVLDYSLLQRISDNG
jgi:CRP/FNR family transcriptional regulator